MLINVFSIAYSCSIRETFSLQNVMIFFKGVFLLTKKKIDYFVIFATKVCITTWFNALQNLIEQLDRCKFNALL